MIIDWGTSIINIYKTDMIQVQETPTEIWQLDIPTFKNTLGDLLDDEAGMIYPDIFSHNPQVIVGGAVLAKVVEILEPYTITFEDGQYAVNLVGANSNIGDRINVNQVSIRSANSAGLQDLTSLQAASFGDGAVALDQVNGIAGTTFPIGTKGKPSNNWQDARVIAEARNLNTIIIIGTATCGAGDDISNMVIVGTNPMLSILSVDTDAITDDVYMRELYFTGVLDGGTILRDCVLGDIQYFNGYIENCALTSSTIYVNGTGVFLNCAAGATCLSNPVIDLTNAAGIAIRHFDGSLELVNKTTDGQCEVGINGMLYIDSSITAGSFEIYGDGWVENNGTGTSFVDDKTSGTPEEIAEAVWVATTRTLTEGGSGATPQEIWEYTARTLTGDITLDIYSITRIVKEIWGADLPLDPTLYPNDQLFPS